MSTAYSSSLEDEIRQIICALSKEGGAEKSGQLVCTADQDGMSSGIPGAFADALARFDQTGFTNERFHVLIAELIFVVGREQQSRIRQVQIRIEGRIVQFGYST